MQYLLKIRNVLNLHQGLNVPSISRRDRNTVSIPLSLPCPRCSLYFGESSSQVWSTAPPPPSLYQNAHTRSQTSANSSTCFFFGFLVQGRSLNFAEPIMDVVVCPTGLPFEHVGLDCLHICWPVGLEMRQTSLYSVVDGRLLVSSPVPRVMSCPKISIGFPAVVPSLFVFFSPRVDT